MVCQICEKECKEIVGLLSHISKKHKVSSKEYFLRFLGNAVFCKLCGKETNFKNILLGFSLVCSDCKSLYGGLKNKQKLETLSLEEKDEIRKKREKTTFGKYGVKNVFQSDLIQKRIEENNLIKYNVKHTSSLTSVRNKISLTKKNVGEEKKELINQKRENSTIEKYGVDNVAKSDIIKQKSKQTLFEKYGDENFVNVKKCKQTKFTRYEDENFNNLKKMKQTKLTRYGSENYVNSEKAKLTRFKTQYNKLLTTDRLKSLVIPLFSIDNYHGCDELYSFKCQKCNSEFQDKLINGNIPRCLNCFPKLSSGISLLEKELVEFIKSLLQNEIIIENDKKVISPKELDIYIPSKNVAIEFNGIYFHSEIFGNKNRFYHLEKTQECEKKGIKLIHIFEDEWIFKNDIVKEKLKNILVESGKIIFARNCTISEINSRNKNEFLEKYHIQGQDKSSIKLGAYFNNELVGVMTFGKQRIALGLKNKRNDEYELIRFATKYLIIGLASKMLNYFIKNYNPIKIVSYADRRWTYFENNLYERIGFKKVNSGIPNYWYIINGQRVHRFNYRKNILNTKIADFNSNLTEWENMQLNGYDRIRDCGNLKYEMLLKN